MDGLLSDAIWSTLANTSAKVDPVSTPTPSRPRPRGYALDPVGPKC